MAGRSRKRCWVFLPNIPASSLVCLFKLAQQGLEDARVVFFFYYGQISTISCADIALGSNHMLSPFPTVDQYVLTLSRVSRQGGQEVVHLSASWVSAGITHCS